MRWSYRRRKSASGILLFQVECSNATQLMNQPPVIRNCSRGALLTTNEIRLNGSAWPESNPVASGGAKDCRSAW